MARTKAKRAAEEAAQAADLVSSAARIAWLLQSSHATVSDALASTDMPRAEDGTMAWPEVHAWARRHGRFGFARAGGSTSGGVADHRGQLERYKALTAKREYEEAMGQLVPKADVDREVRSYVGTLRGSLMALPPQVAPAMVGQTVREAEAFLSTRITQICEQLQRGRFAIDPKLAAKIARVVSEHYSSLPS